MKIIDSLLVPYEIHVDSDQYTVTKKTGSLDKKGNENHQAVGYYNKLASALGRIAKEQVLAGKTDATTTLKEFITAIQTREDLLIQSIKI